MNPVTMSELRNPDTIFDRSASMPRPPRKHPHSRHRELEISQCAGHARLHPQLPPTPVWTYEGVMPGPAMVVHSGERVRVTHDNDIAGTLPYRHVVVVTGKDSMNEAGSHAPSEDEADKAESERAAALHGWTVTHLHGAPSGPDSDGWAENVIGYGDVRRDEYEFPRESWPMTDPDRQTVVFRAGAAPAYWYHDHAMGVTRFNVYAGLAGIWLVRDPVEHHLGLPVDPDREIPLVIADRNLDTEDGSPDTPLNGHLLHKVETDVREAFAPVNLVNGLAWPTCPVSRQVHRLRILNGSNARTYRLHFHALRDGQEDPGDPLLSAALQQIGTDSGLLGQAVDLPNGNLILAPGERADVLVDFGQLDPKIRHVVVWNSAPAPFGGPLINPNPEPEAVGRPDTEGYLTTPQVMRFDLAVGAPRPHLDGTPIKAMALDPEHQRVPTDHDHLPTDHGHTLVALMEEEVILRNADGTPRRGADGTILTHAMLFLHEMVSEDVADRHGCNMFKGQIELVDPGDNTRTKPGPAGIRLKLPDKAVHYVTIGKRFNDTTMAMATLGSWHMWKIVNLSPDTHPFHIHLSQFQAIHREQLTPAKGALDPAQTRDIEFTTSTDDVLDANEIGWKDTFRVNPGKRDKQTDAVITAEMVTVLGSFAAHAGRYMYHCHILEHEDMEMMRPFVVMPGDLMGFAGTVHH